MNAPAPAPAPPVAMPAPTPSQEFLSLIPHEFARRHLILSSGARGSTEGLLVADRTDPAAVFNVGVCLGRGVAPEPASPEWLASAIDRAYLDSSGRDAPEQAAGGVVEGSDRLEQDLEAAVREAESDLLDTRGKAAAVRLVDLLLFEALQRSASDVHIQPVKDRTLVRYRLDGVLHTVRSLPVALAASVISRVKVMGRMDVAEQRAPQDGRATVSIGGPGQSGRRVDLRISTLPSTYGERLVIRLLDPARSAALLSFAGLGMPEAVQRGLLAQVGRTHGIVLSTGPTGSGKTTTLYTTLAWISAQHAGRLARGCELNMLTIEDPVEYDLTSAGAIPGGLAVSQTQVEPRKNVTFATGLRHILRQDPDVIMVGEIRDEETAKIAVQASLTGHLVLSTLHTNDAASAIARLIDLSVEPFLVASSLMAVLAQRLVRTLHRECRGEGCEGCLHTGHKGRTGVFELLTVDDVIRDMIIRRCGAGEIKAAARSRGMTTLQEAGRVLVRSGIVSEQELIRVIDSVDEAIGGAP